MYQIKGVGRVSIYYLKVPIAQKLTKESKGGQGWSSKTP